MQRDDMHGGGDLDSLGGAMSVSGIGGSSFFNYDNQNVQNNFQQFQQDFQQLGTDLQAGNLSAAQNDFTALQQLTPQNNASGATQTQNSNPIGQAFNQLATDLQAGNLSAAQQDYTQIQQDFQSQAAQGGGHHHHHHGDGGGAQGAGGQIQQLFGELGTALQAGNLSNAQQVYATLQQDFQQLGQGNGASGQPAQSGSGTLSVNA
jgi:hypothetical protein